MTLWKSLDFDTLSTKEGNSCEKIFRPSAGFELSEKFDLTENVSLHEKIRYLTYLRFDLTENLLYVYVVWQGIESRVLGTPKIRVCGFSFFFYRNQQKPVLTYLRSEI